MVKKLQPPKPVDDYFDLTVLATPGNYTVSLSKLVDGQQLALDTPKPFKIVPLAKGALEGASNEEIIAFRNTFEAFQQDLNATQFVLGKNKLKIDAMHRALQKATSPTDQLFRKIHDARTAILAIDSDLNGNKAKAEVGERPKPNPNSVSFLGAVALSSSTYGPTPMHKSAINVAMTQLSTIKNRLETLVGSTIPALEAELKAAGAPWIEGQGLIQN